MLRRWENEERKNSGIGREMSHKYFTWHSIQYFLYRLSNTLHLSGILFLVPSVRHIKILYRLIFKLNLIPSLKLSYCFAQTHVSFVFFFCMHWLLTAEWVFALRNFKIYFFIYLFVAVLLNSKSSFKSHSIFVFLKKIRISKLCWWCHKLFIHFLVVMWIITRTIQEI